MEYHGDEDWIDSELEAQQQAHEELCADDWKYETEEVCLSI